MKRILSLCALIAIFVTTATAQAVYDRTPGKSLQYTITSEVATTAVAPQGEQVVDVEGDGLITVTFAAADTVEAMYDKYDLAIDMAGNEQAMDLLTMMTGGFTMTMSANGAVDVLSTPSLSAPMNLPGGNIAQQFDSFFLELPEDDLAEGTTWTTTKETMMQEGVTSTVESTYTVQGSTTKAGMDVLIIKMNATTEVDGETEQQGMSVIINLKGTQTGEYYYSVEEGVMVGSEITQDVSGGQDMEGGGQSMAIDIDITGTNTTMLVTE